MARPRSTQVLVLEDDAALREVLCDELRSRGHEITAVESVASALSEVAARAFDVAVLDLTLPDGSGIDVLRRISEEKLPTEVVILTGNATVSTAIEAMKLGAYDYLIKPTRLEELEVLVEKAAEKTRLRRENEHLRSRIERLEPFEGFLTEDVQMREVLAIVDQVAPSDIPVLIQGETGTGKELIARAIHRRSPRANQPFVAINCSAVSENLLESELFGHERGAFTGAVERKPGLLEAADRGVLFLDEVGDIVPGVQVKLLRALETGEFLRVGGVRPVRTDTRIVSATHKDLRHAVSEKQYREDLYHRLNGVTIKLTPLRARQGDIELLSVHFLNKFSNGRKTLSPRCLEILKSYSWPGNVRELRMVLQRAAILSKDEVVDPKSLLLELWDPRSRGTWRGLTLAEVEAEYIMAVLEEQRGHRGKAAKLLGIDPKTLYNKLKDIPQAPENAAGTNSDVDDQNGNPDAS